VAICHLELFARQRIKNRRLEGHCHGFFNFDELAQAIWIFFRQGPASPAVKVMATPCLHPTPSLKATF
jgi:hypothetical protein